MTESEIPLKIIDVQGVSNQVLAEDLPNQYCSVLQNLYERRLGELMRKGGTQSITTTFPESTAGTPVKCVTGIDNALILRKKSGDKIHVQAVHTNNVVLASDTFVNLATASFVTASGGNWGTVLGSPANTRLDTAGKIQLQYHGFGFNFAEELAVVRGANNTLRITVPANIDPRILGINVYTTVEVWTALSGAVYSVWVGYIDLNAAGTRGTNYDFSQAPITQTGAPGVTGVMFGSVTKPNYRLVATTGGTLTPGKTYFVSVMEQYMCNDALGSPPGGTAFRVREETVQSITLGAGQNAIAVIPNASPPGDSACYLIAVGEDQQLMQPIFITNVFAAPADINYIYTLPLASPNVAGIYRVDAQYSMYMWAACDAACYDMFFRYSSSAATGTLPIYVARTLLINTWSITSSRFVGVDIYGGYVIAREKGYMSDGARYRFTQYGEAGLIVNDTINSRGTSPVNVPGDYLITDGKVAAVVIMDFGVTYVPKSTYITTFQESVAMGGGLLGSEAYSNVYFSNAYNVANFSDTGSGAALAFVGLDTAGEPIMGMGIYSITTADEGVNTQFIVGSRTKLFKLNTIPDSSAFGSAYMDQLSNKIGLASHETIVNTEIGTIICGLDDLYLLRDSGEPSPIGQDVANFINPLDKSTGLDTSYWNAVYHDGHYKLAYSIPGASAPTLELWLNIKKTKANKGKPSWYGPHTGRTIQYSIVDEPLAQGETSKRIIINTTTDTNNYADDPAYLTDIGATIPTVLEKEFVGDGGEFANKKVVRHQVRGRATARINMLSKWYADGELKETSVTAMIPLVNRTEILSQPTQVFPFFPAGRVRGRTLKLRLETETQERFGISGLLIGVRAERRRI